MEEIKTMTKIYPQQHPQRLIERFGKEYLYQVWAELGMYKSAERLSKEFGEYISYSTMRWLSHKYNWKRIVTDKSLQIYKAVLRGTQKAEFYQHIIFK